MLTEKTITRKTEEYNKFERLYRTAFPREERVPLKYLMRKNSGNHMAACCDGSMFCGFYATWTYGDITWITFLAVAEELRCSGYGSQLLDIINAHFSGNRIILDIEEEDSNAKNNAQRIRRKAFYMRNGFVASGIKYSWNGVSYEIMIRNGNITETEFESLWNSIDDE